MEQTPATTSEPAPPRRADLGAAVRQVLVVLVVFAVAGALAGVVWEWVWTPPTGVVVRHEFVQDTEGLRRDFSGTGLYILVATLAGLLVGVPVAVLTDRRELLTLCAVVVGSALAGWVMLRVGLALDPPDPRPLAATAQDYTRLPDRLHVEGLSPFVAFPGGALVGLVVAFLGLARKHGNDA